MIRVKRPANVPRHLATHGPAKTDVVCQSVAAGAEVEVERAFLRHRTIQSALSQAQHGKCCYCERKTRSGDVEHFRPVQSTRQTSSLRSRQKPGYYWLTYEWQNLIWACRECNQYRKNDRFPLSKPSRRARSPADDLTAETPLLINPATEDPEQHITFHAEEVLALDARGGASVEVLGLNEADIRGLRQEKYERMRFLYDLYQRLHASGDNAEEESIVAAELKRYAEDSAEYTAMARAALRAWQIPGSS